MYIGIFGSWIETLLGPALPYQRPMIFTVLHEYFRDSLSIPTASTNFTLGDDD